MADPLRDQDTSSRIEELLLAGLDHYFNGQHELAISVWTRVLFFDRAHARARAYIERARGAIAERQREGEELLQTGIAAFERGETTRARELLTAAVERHSRPEEALALIERIDRLAPVPVVPAGPGTARSVPRARRMGKMLSPEGTGVSAAAIAAVLAVGLAGAGSALIVAAVVMVYISSFGLIYPNAAHEAVHPLPEIAGLASAVLVTTQMLFGALGGVIAAALYRDASPLALGAIMSAAALAAAALYAFWLRGKVEA